MLDIKSMAISFELFGAFVSLMLGAFFFLQKNKDEIDRDIMNVVSLGALLLISDSMTYLYDGVTTDVGFIINKLATFLVYTCNYTLLTLFGKCLIDYIKPNKKQRCVFCVVFICIIISLIMLVASQFFDIIYYFDEFNVYHRTNLYFLSQITSFIGIFCYGYFLLKNKNKMMKNEYFATLCYVVIPSLCTIIQTFIYGFPFQILSLVISGWLLFLTRDLAVRNNLKQALDSKDSYLSKMSHDLRTPLNGIIGLLDINDNHPDDTELNQRSRDKARVAANHLLSLLNDVLELSKLDSQRATLIEEPFDLRDVLEEVETISKLKAESMNINLICNYNDGLTCPYVYGSSLHMKQILLNLVDNAIKYNKKDGYVELNVNIKRHKEDLITYEFVVKDNGLGIDKEYLDHIFEPFSQENQNFNEYRLGTGLGMSIVKGLVELMKGSISVTSKKGVGSTFEVVIPFKIAPEIVKNTKDSKVSIKGKKVLLVEDNDLNREIAKTLLEDEGVLVSEAVDGLDALKVFEESEIGYFDLILMDVVMPNMNGLSATRAIRELNRIDSNLPIIALSANAYAEDIKKTKDAGMDDYVSKPFKIENLVEMIDKYC